MRTRALVVCPGRGSYDRASLGTLKDRSPAARAVVEACDAYRASRGRPTVTAMDSEAVYRGSTHVAGEHASLLTFACSLADFAELARDRFDVVGVAGNSMGWYTALAVAGALSLEHAITLVDTMGWYQRDNVIGGQIMYPLTDDSWQIDPALEANVERALARVCDEGHVAEWSIRLGGFAILGADKEGTQRLLALLPPEQRGDRTFPVQLPLHSAFHTSLMEATSARARTDLAALRFRAPEISLVDGRGQVFRPLTAEASAIASYTLGHQVVRPYDFTSSIVTALHATGPEVVIVLGPGNSLGGPLARILTLDGWGGARTKAAFEESQRRQPSLLSFGVSKQRSVLV